MKNEKIQNWRKMEIPALEKELGTFRKQILEYRMDIANQKTKGIDRINKTRKNIARVLTIINQKSFENDK